jgi:energy-coupling factor transport system permease protein
MSYRRRASPLHATRAAIAICWCAALGLAGLIEPNPIMLGATLACTLGAGALAGVGRALLRTLRWSLPMLVTITLINALVSRDGLTVIWRFGELPLLGHLDVTLQATVYGAVLGLRAVVLVSIGALYSAAVDPDEVLALFRSLSFRSALSATVATRMVPVLARDARRLAEAQRCRSGPRPGRLTLLRASTAGVLDRALDVAATLEVRGYGVSRKHGRGRGGAERRFTRHDIGFLLSALVVAGVAIAALISGAGAFSAYPLLRAPAGARTLSAAVVLVLAALLPFADRRGIER